MLCYASDAMEMEMEVLFVSLRGERMGMRGSTVFALMIGWSPSQDGGRIIPIERPVCLISTNSFRKGFRSLVYACSRVLTCIVKRPTGKFGCGAIPRERL